MNIVEAKHIIIYILENIGSVDGGVNGGLTSSTNVSAQLTPIETFKKVKKPKSKKDKLA